MTPKKAKRQNFPRKPPKICKISAKKYIFFAPSAFGRIHAHGAPLQVKNSRHYYRCRHDISVIADLGELSFGKKPPIIVDSVLMCSECNKGRLQYLEGSWPMRGEDSAYSQSYSLILLRILSPIFSQFPRTETIKMMRIQDRSMEDIAQSLQNISLVLPFL